MAREKFSALPESLQLLQILIFAYVITGPQVCHCALEGLEGKVEVVDFVLDLVKGLLELIDGYRLEVLLQGLDGVVFTDERVSGKVTDKLGL